MSLASLITLMNSFSFSVWFSNNPFYLSIIFKQRVAGQRSEEHTSELQSLRHLVCRLLLEKKQRQVASERREKRGLAGTIGAKNYQVFAAANGPVQTIENGRIATPDRQDADFKYRLFQYRQIEAGSQEIRKEFGRREGGNSLWIVLRFFPPSFPPYLASLSWFPGFLLNRNFFALFFFIIRLPPRSTLFPYTTLFR